APRLLSAPLLHSLPLCVPPPSLRSLRSAFLPRRDQSVAQKTLQTRPQTPRPLHLHPRLGPNGLGLRQHPRLARPRPLRPHPPHHPLGPRPGRSRRPPPIAQEPPAPRLPPPRLRPRRLQRR